MESKVLVIFETGALTFIVSSDEAIEFQNDWIANRKKWFPKLIGFDNSLFNPRDIVAVCIDPVTNEERLLEAQETIAQANKQVAKTVRDNSKRTGDEWKAGE